MQKKASRNKTIDLSPKEINAYARRSLKLGFKASLDYVLDSTIHQDTLKTLDYLPDNSVDLIIADPPYNLTKVFGNSVFKERDFNDYKKWLDGWLKKLPRILKETGSVYICSDWRTSITIPEIAGKRNCRKIFHFAKPHFLGTGKGQGRQRQLEKLSGRHLVLYQIKRLYLQSGCRKNHASGHCSLS